MKASWKLLLLFLFPCEYLQPGLVVILLFAAGVTGVILVLFGLMIMLAGYFLDMILSPECGEVCWSESLVFLVQDGDTEDSLDEEDSEDGSCSTPESLPLLDMVLASTLEEEELDGVGEGEDWSSVLNTKSLIAAMFAWEVIVLSGS